MTDLVMVSPCGFDRVGAGGAVSAILRRGLGRAGRSRRAPVGVGLGAAAAA